MHPGSSHRARYAVAALLCSSTLFCFPTWSQRTTLRAADSGLAFVDQLRHGPGVANHPVGILPSQAVRIPSGWPLAPDGTVTCTTCHQRLPALDGTAGPSLRGVAAPTPAFCANCHRDGQASGGSAHWRVLGVAHVPNERRTSRSARGGTVDAWSRRCLACHDGVTAPETHSRVPTAGVPTISSDPRREHSVGVPYAREPGDRSSVLLKPAALLRPTVRLPEGKVSCVSCHNLYEPGRHHLSVTMIGSALCFTCHQMD